jgi:hypothetical protein
MSPEPGIYLNMPELLYRQADGISFTTVVRNLIIDSPSRAKYLIDNPIVPTPAMVLGSAFDCMLFNPDLFDKSFVLLPENYDARKKEFKDMKIDIENRGLKPVKNADLVNLEIIVDSVRNHPQCKDLFTDCKYQVAVFWIDEKTGIKCKGLIDMVAFPPLGFLLDVKTCGPSQGASSYNLVKMFQSQYEDKFYDGQITFYQRGLESHFGVGSITERGLIVVSKVAPHDVVLYDIDHDDIDYSNAQIDLALSKYRELNGQKYWPGYLERRTISRRPFAKQGLESELITGEMI